MITISTAGLVFLLLLILVPIFIFGIIATKQEEENDKLKIENELLKKELQPYREKKEKQNKKQELKELLKEIEQDYKILIGEEK